MMKPCFFLPTLFITFLSSCVEMKQSVLSRQFIVERQWVRQTQQIKPRKTFNYHFIEPIVTSQAIYQGNVTDGISAYERDSGRFLWNLPIKNGLGGTPQISKNTLYFGGNNGHFYAVKASTGQIQWSFPTQSESLGKPSIHANSLYFMSSDNTLYVLDKTTGRQKWLYARQSSADLTLRIVSEPLVYGSMVYVGFTDGVFVALDIQNGQLQWKQQLNDNKIFNDISTLPVRDGNRLYVTSYDGFLFCLDITSGDVIWQIDGGGHTPVTIEKNRLFYSDSHGFVRAIDKVSGKKIWDLKLKEGIASQPKFFKGLIVFGASEGDLMFVDANTGETKSRYAAGRGVTGTPYIDRKTGDIYFIAKAAHLFALKASWKKPYPALPWENQ